MAKKKDERTPRERFIDDVKAFKKELETAKADLEAFMTGGIGPTQQAYIDKINAAWDKYNFIVVFGHAYMLTNEQRRRDNGTLHTPCENCELAEYCVGSGNQQGDDERTLCKMMNAETDEWFKDVGEVNYDKKMKRFKIEPWDI